MAILISNNVTDEKSFEEHFGRLSFFLRPDDKVTIIHQAMYQWLLSEHNDDYRIFLKAGHILIARHLFGVKASNIRVKDVVNLAIHVSNSNDAALVNMFKSLRLPNDTVDTKDKMLHSLIWRSSSVEALKLLLGLQSEVDILNQGGVTPAFVAAAKGHLEQLKCLHMKGADLSFTVEPIFTIKAVNIITKIEMIKGIYYSGFNLIHIAAKHGYTDIIQYLTGVNRTLISVKNSVGMRPSDIACENGQITSLQTLAVFNKSYLDYTCMYHAAKTNQLEIVKLLTERGMKLQCIGDGHSETSYRDILNVFDKLDNGSLIHSRFQDDVDEDVTRLITPLDVWWKVFKDNPLLAAIKTGSDSSAIYLIEKFPELLQCKDMFGYTASLLAIVYNRTFLLPLLADKLSTDYCSQNSSYNTIISIGANNLVHAIAERDDCPVNATAAHILAIHNRKEFSLILFKHNIIINWEARDGEGNLPIHYAVANSNLFFIVFMKHMELDLSSMRSENGSTAWHIACITASLTSFFALTDGLKEVPPNLKDNNNRSLLHYVVMGNSSDTINARYIFSLLIEKFNYDILQADSFGRNVLHYALHLGHWKIVNYLTTNHSVHLANILQSKDNEGSSPVEFSLKNVPKIKKLILPKTECNYFNIFNFCPEDINSVLSDWEMSMLQLIHYCLRSQLTSYIDSFISDILVKSVHLSTALFVYYKHIPDSLLRDHIIQSYRNSPAPSPYTLVFLVLHRPHILHQCNEPLSRSPMHFIMLNNPEKIKPWISKNATYFLLENVDDDLFFIRHVFGDPINMTFINCPDKNGYNIFHYALMNGNLPAANFLMKKGVNIINEKVKLIDLFYITLFARVKLDYAISEEDYEKYKRTLAVRQLVLSDEFLRKLLREFKHNLRLQSICEYGKSKLSLVHILAIGGFQNTLKEAMNIFGDKVLTCENADGFTPVYFANIFHDGDLLPANVSVKGNYESISQISEEILFYCLETKFPLTTFHQIKCRHENVMLCTTRMLTECDVLEKLIEDNSISQPVFGVLQKQFLAVTTSLKKIVYALKTSNVLLKGKASLVPCIVLMDNVKLMKFEISYINGIAFLDQPSHFREKASYLLKIADKSFKRGLTKCMAKCSCRNLNVTYMKLKAFFGAFRQIVQLTLKGSREDLIHGFLHLSKKVLTFIGQHNSFLNLRMTNRGYNVFQAGKRYNFLKIVPVVKYKDTDLRRLNYLRVIKSTFAYKSMRFEIKEEFKGSEFILMKESAIKQPFEGMDTL